MREVIAVLDDDMSPKPDWVKGAMDICEQNPDSDIFTRQTKLFWPAHPIPEWTKHSSI